MPNLVHVGSHPAHVGVVERIDSAKQLTRSDSGKLFMCYQDSAADYVVNLPQLSTEIAGWHSKFILVDTASDSGYDIQVLAYGLSEGGGAGTDANSVRVLVLKNNTSVVDNSTGDGIEFTASAIEEGCTVEVITDGTRWWAIGWAVGGTSIAIIAA